MRDPYDILGVTYGATEEEVQEAYRARASELPMNDPNNIAVQNLNAAYDQIIEEMRGQTEESTSQSSNAASDFSDIRRLLQNGQTGQAEELLDGIPPSMRTAEWSFLKGTVCYNRGFLDMAYDYLKAAAEADPSNAEYVSAYNQVAKQGSGYMQGNPYGNAGQTMACNLCTTLACLNCCSSCCGGGCVG